ncbi:MAG: RCC1 domain-containing protein [Lysobacteraceae bacterium]
MVEDVDRMSPPEESLMPHLQAISLIRLVKSITKSLQIVLIGLSLGLASTHLAAQVPFSDAVDMTVGYAHVCALSAGGAVRCWGGNDEGQLGDGSTTDRAIADAVSVLEYVPHLRRVSGGKRELLGSECLWTTWRWQHLATVETDDRR